MNETLKTSVLYRRKPFRDEVTLDRPWTESQLHCRDVMQGMVHVSRYVISRYCLGRQLNMSLTVQPLFLLIYFYCMILRICYNFGMYAYIINC